MNIRTVAKSLIFGGIGMIIASCLRDTSVSGYHNLARAAAQQNGILLGGFSFLGGILLWIADRWKEKPEPQKPDEEVSGPSGSKPNESEGIRQTDSLDKESAAQNRVEGGLPLSGSMLKKIADVQAGIGSRNVAKIQFGKGEVLPHESSTPRRTTRRRPLLDWTYETVTARVLIGILVGLVVCVLIGVPLLLFRLGSQTPNFGGLWVFAVFVVIISYSVFGKMGPRRVLWLGLGIGVCLVSLMLASWFIGFVNGEDGSTELFGVLLFSLPIGAFGLLLRYQEHEA